MNAFLRPRKPPFIRGEPGQHGDQWLMTEADLEDYARADRAQRAPLTDVRIEDDNALRFACRVLDSGSSPPDEDKAAAREGLEKIRTRLRTHKIGAKP